MTARFFQSGSVDWGANASWNTAADGSGTALLPTAGDDCWILEGTQEITDNLDALAAIDIDSLTIGPNAAVTTAPGTNIDVNCTGPVTYNGRGSLFAIEATTAAITTLEVDSSAGLLIVADGTISTTYMRSGRCQFNGDAVATSIYQSGGNLLLFNNATEVTTFIGTGGTCTTKRELRTTQLIGPHVLNVIETGQLTDQSAGSGSVLLGGGCYVNYAGRVAIETVSMYGGTFDPTNAQLDFGVDTLNLYNPRSTTEGFYATAGSISVTIGTTNNYSGAGTLTKV